MLPVHPQWQHNPFSKRAGGHAFPAKQVIFLLDPSRIAIIDSIKIHDQRTMFITKITSWLVPNRLDLNYIVPPFPSHACKHQVATLLREPEVSAPPKQVVRGSGWPYQNCFFASLPVEKWVDNCGQNLISALQFYQRYMMSNTQQRWRIPLKV